MFSPSQATQPLAVYLKSWYALAASSLTTTTSGSYMVRYPRRGRHGHGLSVFQRKFFF